MKYYIGADLGTSSLKLLLVERDGRIAKSVSRSYDVIYPRNGWSEQNPSNWWDAFISGIHELVGNIDPANISGIGVGGQMHGLVALDSEGNVIRNAILWNDGRCEKEVDYLNNVIGKEKLSSLTANIAFAGFTAPKILWMRENEPEKFAKIHRIMLPKDYINYKLTGIHATDYSDASGMLLLDVKNKCWSDEMLKICHIDESVMPKLYNSYDVIGNLTDESAEILGLCKSVAVVAGGGDNAAAAVGTGTVGEGGCNISLGTSGTIFISSKKFSLDSNNALHSFCHADGGYHLMGCILSAASCNKWFCDNILKTSDYSGELSSISEDLLGNNDIYFLPYLMGERSPINDTDARALFIGMTPAADRAQMLLAVLEGVSFAIRDNMEIVKSQGINISESFVCGGGTKSPLWCRILASVLGITLKIPVCEEGPGYGAAMLAMCACGEYETVEKCSKMLVSSKQEVKPEQKLVELYEERYKKYKKIYPTVKKLFKDLKE